MNNIWSFTRYATRVLNEHDDLYNFMEHFVEERVRKHCKVTGAYPTPDYEVINIWPTDDGNIMVEIDIFDYEGYYTIVLKNDEISEEKYFNFFNKI